MNARFLAYAVSASAIAYAFTVFSYSAAVRSSSERSAILQRAAIENNRLAYEPAQLEATQRALAARLRRLTLVTDARSFERLLERIAVLAQRSHVEVTGLLPDPAESTDRGSRYRGRGLTIRGRARFTDALTFARMLPAGGILLRLRDIAFAQHQDWAVSQALDVTVHLTLLRPAADWLQDGSNCCG